MKTADWDDPSIRAVGRKWAAEAYEIASELHNYGADAAQLLLSYRDQDMSRPREITIPAMLADVVMAVLLHLQRPPEPPLDESVLALMRRIKAR